MNRREFIKSSSTALAAGALLGGLPGVALGAGAADQPARLRFGVNYVPRKRWWYAWQDWDQQSVADDMNGLAAIGVDHIRILCLWPLFQPGIGVVSERMLANLFSLFEGADKAGIDVQVAVLNGWLSGLIFLPAWVAPLGNKGGKNRNMFTSPEVIEAEKLLFQKIADTVGQHKRFLGFDLGNELGCMQAPLMGYNPATPQEADAWASEMLNYCDEIAPDKFHVNGVDYSHWTNDWGFTRSNLATTGHASVVHSYLVIGVLKSYRFSDPPALRLAEYMVELAYAYQTDLRRRVWVQEFGVHIAEAPESYKPEFMEHTIRNVAATGKAWGVTWWCSHEIDPAYQEFDSQKLMGLLDRKNQPTLKGKKFAALASEFENSPPIITPRKKAIVIPDQGRSTKQWPADWEFTRPSLELFCRGEASALVPESRAKDEAYLKERGITELIYLSNQK